MISNTVLIYNDRVGGYDGITAYDFQHCTLLRFVPAHKDDSDKTGLVICFFQGITDERRGYAGGAHRIYLTDREHQIAAIRCFEAAKHCVLDAVREAMGIEKVALSEQERKAMADRIRRGSF